MPREIPCTGLDGENDMPKLLRISFPDQQDIATVEVSDEDYAEIEAAIEEQRKLDPDTTLTPAMMLSGMSVKTVTNWGRQKRSEKEEIQKERIVSVLDRFPSAAEREEFLKTVEGLANQPPVQPQTPAPANPGKR
jgi:hypothetical protein